MYCQACSKEACSCTAVYCQVAVLDRRKLHTVKSGFDTFKLFKHIAPSSCLCTLQLRTYLNTCSISHHMQQTCCFGAGKPIATSVIWGWNGDMHVCKCIVHRNAGCCAVHLCSRAGRKALFQGMQGLAPVMPALGLLQRQAIAQPSSRL